MALTILQKLRTEARLTLESVAADIELSTSQVQRFEKGEREPRLSDLQRIAKRFGITVAELIGEHSSLDVPLLRWDDLSIYLTNNRIPESIIRGHTYVADLPPGNWIALYVNDDSMDRIAPLGSTIIVNIDEKEFEDEKYYIVKSSNDTIVFRRFRRNPDRLQPYSTNPEHETFHLPKSHVIIGRVWRVKTDLN